MIYADHAATSGTKPEPVIQEILAQLRSPGNSGRGSCGTSLQVARTVFEAREKIATFFQADAPEQVAFTSGITESLNLAIHSLLESGMHVITTWAEHNSVLRPLYQKERDGAFLTITDPTPEAILKAWRPNTQLVVMTHGSNVTGDVYDIRSVGKLCRQKGAVFVVDTAQTAGLFPIFMKEDAIDVLCFSGHKGLLGPQGIGGLCVRSGVELKPFKVGGSGIYSFSRQHPSNMPERLEAGTLNTPGIAGLSAAISFLQEKSLGEIRQREQNLAEYFYKGIADLPGMQLYGKFENWKARTPVISLNLNHYDSAQVSDELCQRFGIQTRAGAHCAPLVHQHFHTEAQGMVRFSFGWNTTESEIQTCIQAMQTLANEG
jgi:cysteine desulfurase family protein